MSASAALAFLLSTSFDLVGAFQEFEEEQGYSERHQLYFFLAHAVRHVFAHTKTKCLTILVIFANIHLH